jgi:hypothetical protein
MIRSVGWLNRRYPRFGKPVTVNNGVHVPSGTLLCGPPRNTPAQAVRATHEHVPRAVLARARPCSSVLVPFVHRPDGGISHPSERCVSVS